MSFIWDAFFGRVAMVRRYLFRNSRFTFRPSLAPSSFGPRVQKGRQFSSFRRRVVRRGCLFPKKGSVDEFFSPDSWSVSGQESAQYISLPTLGQGRLNRSGRVIKLWSLYISGNFEFRRATDPEVNDEDQVDPEVLAEARGNVVEKFSVGFLYFFVIVDRSPVPNVRVTLSDVLGVDGVPHSFSVDGIVKASVRSRFSIILRFKEAVPVGSSGFVLPFSRMLWLSRGRNLLSSFFDQSLFDGSHNNTKCNSVWVFSVWKCPDAVLMRPTLSSRLTFFH